MGVSAFDVGRNGPDSRHRDGGVVGDHADRDADSWWRREDISRVAGHYWIQNQSVFPFATHNERQNIVPFGSELFFLWPVLLTKS